MDTKRIKLHRYIKSKRMLIDFMKYGFIPAKTYISGRKVC